MIRPYIVITNASPEDLLNNKIASIDYLGILLKDLIDNEGASFRSVRLALNEYLSRRLIGSNPDESDQFISLNVLRNRTKTDINYDGTTIYPGLLELKIFNVY